MCEDVSRARRELVKREDLGVPDVGVECVGLG